MIQGIEFLQSAIDKIEQRQLADALNIMQGFVEINPQSAVATIYEEIRNSYHYMLDYMRKGVDDPERGKMYRTLLNKTFAMLIDTTIDYAVERKSVCMNAHAMTVGKQDILTIAEIRSRLEDFVSSMAMTELMTESEKKSKRDQLYEAHHNYINLVFNSIMIARHWNESDCQEMEQLILSPTIETMDRQLIVSAVMLNVMQFFDINKFLLLVNVYQKSDDERIRQRALLGWVLTTRESADVLFPQQKEIVHKIEDDGERLAELLELQEQLIFCDDTDRFTDKIQKEIIPDLMKNNKNLNITRFGIEEKEDPMQDILDPGASDRAMEDVEKSMGKMMDMMKQGSDIYFGGFSQMKRYPFFNDIVNWFSPFYIEHPGLRSITGDCLNSSFMTNLMRSGPFCDSDKYSFALTIDKVFGSMPPQVKEMISNGDSFGTPFPEEEMLKKIYIRRMYLQDIYRFFRLYNMRSEFVDVFGLGGMDGKAMDYCDNRFVFLANPVFKHHAISGTIEKLTAFLIKRNKPFVVQKLMDDETSFEKRKYKYEGMQYARNKKWKDAARCFNEYLDSEPQDGIILKKTLGPVYLKAEDYNIAAGIYHDLCLEHPENIGYAKKYCLCLSNTRQYKEALKQLYKLNYELPDDLNVVRLLAWNTMAIGQFDKSAQYYSRLTASVDAIYQDSVYAGCCSWLQGNMSDAVKHFSVVKNNTNLDAPVSPNWFRTFFAQDAEILKSHGLTESDFDLMSDVVAGDI